MAFKRKILQPQTRFWEALRLLGCALFKASSLSSAKTKENMVCSSMLKGRRGPKVIADNKAREYQDLNPDQVFRAPYQPTTLHA
jgi:hypothetical protein